MSIVSSVGDPYGGGASAELAGKLARAPIVAGEGKLRKSDKNACNKRIRSEGSRG